MSKKIFALISLSFVLCVDWIGNAQVIVRHQTNYLEPDDESFILDNLVETCARFEANESQLDSYPQYTTLRVPTVNEDADGLNVTVIGENLNCAEDLFVMLITSAQARDWNGIWMSCPLVKSSLQESWEMCTFQCLCKGDCAQIQVSKRPRTRDQSSWSLCDLHLISSPTEVTGCASIEGNENGIRLINVPDLGGQTLVYCDMVTDGGGWTVVLLRKDGSVSFDREWSDYRAGFGSLTGEFWAGNELLHQLTTDGRTYSVRVLLEDYNDDSIFAVYDNFSVGSESDNYRLHVAGYWNGSSAGDSFTCHSEVMFSTPLRDNDDSMENYARQYRTSWWFGKYLEVLLTGPYCELCIIGRGIEWHQPWGSKKFAKFVKMMIRPNF